jgi:hypothetical protein
VTVTLELLRRLCYNRDQLNSILLPHGTYFIRQFLVFVLFVGYCFGEIMYVRDSCVYQKGVLRFPVRESYVRSVKSYCFVRKYGAVTVQLEIFILRYIGCCVLIEWAFALLLLLLTAAELSLGGNSSYDSNK